MNAFRQEINLKKNQKIEKEIIEVKALLQYYHETLQTLQEQKSLDGEILDSELNRKKLLELDNLIEKFTNQFYSKNMPDIFLKKIQEESKQNYKKAEQFVEQYEEETE